MKTTASLFFILLFSIKPLIAQNNGKRGTPRPDILSIKGRHHKHGEKWNNLKRAHIEAIALIVNIYQVHDIYFLARDAEFLYDQAKLILRKSPEKLKKIHLINVSMKNISSKNILPYLNQEGISQKTLEDGKKILFVDTGFLGTIPEGIKTHFPEKYHKQMQSHFIASENPHIPSTRSFLSWIDPNAADLPIQFMSPSVYKYELITHYNLKSHALKSINGRWIPISYASHPNQYRKALGYMEDLVSFNKSFRAKNLYNQRSKIWKKLYELSKNDDDLLVDYLKTLSSHRANYKKAIARDFIQLSQINNIGHPTPFLSLRDIGLEKPFVTPLRNGAFLAETNPQWEKIFLDPEDEIKKLFHAKDIETIKAMADEVYHFEFLRILFKTLGEKNEKMNRELIEYFITNESLNKKTLPFLFNFTFTQKTTSKTNFLLQQSLSKAIEMKDLKALFHFIAYTMQKLPIEDIELFSHQIMEVALELKEPSLLQDLALYVLPLIKIQNRKGELENKVINTAIELKDPQAKEALKRKKGNCLSVLNQLLAPA